MVFFGNRICEEKTEAKSSVAVGPPKCKPETARSCEKFKMSANRALLLFFIVFFQCRTRIVIAKVHDDATASMVKNCVDVSLRVALI